MGKGTAVWEEQECAESADMPTVCRMNAPDDGHEFVATGDDDPNLASATVDFTPALFFAACTVCTALLARSQYKSWRKQQNADTCVPHPTRSVLATWGCVYSSRQCACYPARHCHSVSWALSLLIVGRSQSTAVLSWADGRHAHTHTLAHVTPARVTYATEGIRKRVVIEWCLKLTVFFCDDVCMVAQPRGASAARAAHEGGHWGHRGGARHELVDGRLPRSLTQSYEVRSVR